VATWLDVHLTRAECKSAVIQFFGVGKQRVSCVVARGFVRNPVAGTETLRRGQETLLSLQVPAWAVLVE